MLHLKKPIKTGLFIGGAWDGQRKQLPHYVPEDHVRVPVLERRTVLDAGLEVDIRVEEYRRETLRARESLWDVWVQKDITIEQALKLLLLNYRPEGKG